MEYPRRVRVADLPAIWHRRSGRRQLGRKLSAAAGALLFCMGVTLMPALAALDLTVGLACQGLNPGACIALFQPPSE